MLIHLALAIIIVGALVTHFFGVQGDIHLRADKAETVTVQPTPYAKPHSVSLFLWDFHILYDDEGNPKDFVSELRLLDRNKQHSEGQMPIDTGIVRMNKPLKYKGFRFCQSDYDSDGYGVVLSYNYDPWGIGITYTGYALLLIAMIGFFFQPRTRFRALLKQSVFGQRSGLYSVSFAVLIIVMAIIMTKVVTPKPPLQPVLQTPLLGIHVSVIMLAYTLFAIIAINGIIGLYAAIAEKKASGLRKEKLSIPSDRALGQRTFNFPYLQIVPSGKELSTLSQLLLYPALFCLTTGIFIGAVWANMSWGRYWGWDPKETWALITMIVYAALLHWPIIAKANAGAKHNAAYHIACIVAFFFVLFTYFGVSYLLGGLHSYN